VNRFVSAARAAVFLLALAGCGLPRGAGFENEVLAGTVTPEGQIARDFAVEPVTRETVALYADWPRSGDEASAGMRWITRQPQPANRIITPGDRVTVTVWSTEENSLLTSPGQRAADLGEITVSPAGTIFLPYVETLRVEGMSPERAREAIQERFVEVIPSAQVQIDLVEGRQSTVSAVSGVRAPGAYPLPDQDYTVMALLAEAGGVDQGLDNPQLRLMRGDAIYGIAVDRLFADPTLDTTLQGGDKVLVEEDSRFFLSLGATGREAEHPFTRERVSAIEALSIIGGVADARANPQGILILRQYPEAALRADGTGPRHARTIFTLDLTSADGLFSAGQFQIMPGDLVYATESPISSAQTVIGLVSASFGLAERLWPQL
jgi:polysaccharide export outer membrane protein